MTQEAASSTASSYYSGRERRSRQGCDAKWRALLPVSWCWSRCGRLRHDRNLEFVALCVGHGQRKGARLRGGVPELQVHPAGVPEDDQRAQGEVEVVGDVERLEWLLLTENAGVAPHLESGGVTARSRSRPPVWMGYSNIQHVVVCDDGTLVCQ